ncbi:MAG: nucleotide sugar dehydrogenase [Candidatus Aenigmarchaeota archaeon]|nr:nucleotide sugar dehydrogenase [Candidatus Aenigmarchaeota archaeon]
METITIVGLGYVGLPLALALSSKGFKVYGYDISESRITAINNGNYGNVDTSFTGQKITATTDPKECIPVSDFVIVCVPTPLNDKKEPNMSFVIDAIGKVSENLKDGATVILESTTYPGTTEELIKPMLDKSNKKFYLGYSPERISPGEKDHPLEKITKIISGINDESLRKVEYLYSHIIEKLIRVKSPKTAEAAKLLENVFRAVNISLVNELAIIFEKIGINIYEVIDAAKTKPMGFMPFYPGPGVGGDCIPVSPMYLAWKAKQVGMESSFISLVNETNAKIADHVISKIKNNMKDGSKILVLGVSYKKGVGDIRNTPAEQIIKKIDSKVDFYDPYIDTFLGIKRVDNPIIGNYDCIVILTDHDEFKNINFSDFKGVVIDTRNFFKERYPVNYIGLGKGTI